MNESPMTKRWRELKEQNPGCIVLFRMGDFYETFYEDAKCIAAVMGPTTRNNADVEPIPMAGFPYHQLDNYVRKLVADGRRVTVCDQVAAARKCEPVQRVVTAETLIEA